MAPGLRERRPQGVQAERKALVAEMADERKAKKTRRDTHTAILALVFAFAAVMSNSNSLSASTSPGRPLFGANAEDVPEPELVVPDVEFTEAELKYYDGTEGPDGETKPIYLAINGTIYDVSGSPTFYGPGTHYHHFVGRDATRAWVTECWDEPEQFTWRMEGIEAMFMPKWLDEEIARAARGDFGDLGGLEMLPQEALKKMAEKAESRFGKVTDEEKEKRRKTDQEEALQSVHDALAHWIGFFSKSDKYTVVGRVVLDDESEPKNPPEPCAAAMQKRPVREGRVGGVMNLNRPGGTAKSANQAPKTAQKPDFVKQKADRDAEPEEEDDEIEHDEL